MRWVNGRKYSASGVLAQRLLITLYGGNKRHRLHPIRPGWTVSDRVRSLPDTAEARTGE